jgi:hypothetical protein
MASDLEVMLQALVQPQPAISGSGIVVVAVDNANLAALTETVSTSVNFGTTFTWSAQANGVWGVGVWGTFIWGSQGTGSLWGESLWS